MPAFATRAALLWAAAAAAAAVAVTTTRPADGARILAVETIPARSHWNFMSAVLRALTDAGHHVTAFTAFPEGGRENYTEVDTSAAWPPRVDRDVAHMAAEYGGPFASAGRMAAFSRACCDALRADRTLAALAAPAATVRFDAVVAEPAAGGADCSSWLAASVPGAPVLILAIATPMVTAAERAYTGHASNPATVANVFAGHGVPRTFARRLSNAALWAYGALRAEYERLTAAAAAAAAAATDQWPYGGDAYATVRPAVVFVNSHHATEAPRPVPPSVVDVGGIHLLQRRGTERRVPEDILDFIEDSPHGVILFTFGSTIRLSSLPKHIEDVFKRVLADVPQKVLWKYETVMDDMPDNVMIKKWFPQREILLHPKVKLFISHGGISGVYEAVDASVPVLGFPLFFDQIRNIEHLVDAEMAISLNLFDVSYDVLFNAITELINNEKYTENAKIASNRFKDRPMSPSQSVVYWTEYVIRHRGAPHLRSHAFDLTWYQYLLLDVIAAVLASVFLVLFYVYKVFKTVSDYFTIIHLVIKLHNKSNK